MSLSLELDYRLRWMDFDRYGRIHPTAVLDMFQDVATVHANSIGIGRDPLIEQGVFWVVVRTKFEIVEEPHHYDVVKVKTWPHSLTRFSFLRDYCMTGVDGNVLVKGTSEWVLMDAATRKFASIKDFYDGPTDFDEERMFERKPRKAPDFAIDGLTPRIVVPSYSDIDVNGHVNNARYGDFCVDAVELGESQAMRTFQIDYRYEAHAGEPLEVYTFTGDGEVLCKGVKPDGSTSFGCRIELA